MNYFFAIYWEKINVNFFLNDKMIKNFKTG